MAAPTAPRAPRLGRPGARSNKNKRLFEGEEGALENGQKLFYRTTQGETLLEGIAVVEPGGPSGILCGCCNTLISASGFEAHAGRGQRRAPYDNIFTEEGMTLKAMAALLPDVEEGAAGERRGAGGQYGLDDLADDAREVISELDTLAGGCVLCHEVDFQRGGFGPRTIMLCDQCEREFHVGCLKKCGVADLDAVPEGDWYCSEECQRIRVNVNTAVQQQQMDIPGLPSHTWQVMRGKDGKTSTAWSLRAAQEILQESFDPIMDLGSNTDLLPVMLYARRAGEWDYSNCLTLLLRHKGKPVVAAICRVFGPQMAELPLIATKNTARRQGHARILVDCFERLLKESGVHTLVLPAAHETVQTWKDGFSFADMPEDDVRLAKKQLRILIFPGTEVLWKQYAEVKPPQGHHVLVPPPDRPSPEEAADAMEVAAITANMVACVAAACGEPVLPEALGMTTEAPAPAQHAQHAVAPAQAQQPQQQPQQEPQQAAPPVPQQQAQARPLAMQQQPAAAEPGPLDDYDAMIAAAIAAGSEAAGGQAAAAGLAEAAEPAAGEQPGAWQGAGLAPMDVEPSTAAAAGAPAPAGLGSDTGMPLLEDLEEQQPQAEEPPSPLVQQEQQQAAQPEAAEGGQLPAEQPNGYLPAAAEAGTALAQAGASGGDVEMAEPSAKQLQQAC